MPKGTCAEEFAKRTRLGVAPTHCPELGPCLEWSNTLCRLGYGDFQWNKRRRKAHVWAWELANGRTVPMGLHVLHRCDNPACVSPAHLWVGTIAENNADRAAKGRSSPLRGEQNPQAKLTESVVRALRDEYRAGARQIPLAAKFGISQSLVSTVVRRQKWGHVL